MVRQKKRMEQTARFVESCNTNVSSRNLHKSDLGGVIFGCKHHTMKECLSKQLFGLPSPHFNYVKNIEEGLPLFLFNYSDRRLHGIFEATSRGQININSYAWTDGDERTQFPAQVSVHFKVQCAPLTEKQFKGIIKDNYYTPQHFWFELDHSQTRALIETFVPLPSSSDTRAVPVTLIQNKMLPVSSTNILKATTSSRYTDARICGLKKDSDMPNDFINQNNFAAIACDDTDSGSNKESCGTIEETENVEPLSDWEEWADKIVQDNLDASDSLDGKNKLQEHEFVTEATENAEVLLKLRMVAATHGDSVQSTDAFIDDRNFPFISKGESIGQRTEEHTITVVKEEDASRPAIAEPSEAFCELKALVENLVKKQVEFDREIQQLRKLAVDSERRIQQLTNHVNELELKKAPSSIHDNKLVVDCLGSAHVIYLVGGYNGISWLSTLRSFSPSLDILTSLKSMSCAHSYASAVSMDGNIYVLGGGDDTSWKNTVECYNPRKDVLTSCPTLLHKKGNLAGCALNGKIYAIGGGDGSQCFYDVEMFDPALGKWLYSRPMLEKRFALAAAELQGIIYAVGGFNGSAYLNTVEMFDHRVGYWTKLPSMNTRRSCHSVAVLNNKLYAIAGHDGDRMTSSVETYDPRASSWVMAEPMNAARGYAATAVLGDSIFVIGGVQDGEVISSTVECYREGSGWRETGLKAVGRLCFSSAVVI
ncbi:uncharacterized protein LOC141825540 [Curcuma longa]|uniref:uncharacterized protein LOC141825540 n=1 Tax=Curcuma longa TaxID=136217 RepID=UPI003D9F85D2